MLPSRLPPHTVSVLPQSGFAFGPYVVLVDSIVPAKFDSGLPNTTTAAIREARVVATLWPRPRKVDPGRPNAMSVAEAPLRPGLTGCGKPVPPGNQSGGLRGRFGVVRSAWFGEAVGRDRVALVQD